MLFKDLLRGTPGKRFRAIHRVRRGRHRLLKAATILAGIVLAGVGVMLVPTPGPGALAVLGGLGLVASESLGFARALDRLELRLRAAIGRESAPASRARASCARSARHRCP